MGQSLSSSSGAVEVSGVSHRYGAVIALDDVSLSLPRGAAVAVVGPDGVGKSTLLSLIAGVKRIQQGTVHALGHDLSARGSREDFLARVAFMPQGWGTISIPPCPWPRTSTSSAASSASPRPNVWHG
jgi:ribosome-dependent ATPase